LAELNRPVVGERLSSRWLPSRRSRAIRNATPKAAPPRAVTR